MRVLPRSLATPARIAVRCPTRPAWASAYTTRNAPTVFNAAYSPLWQFWDGRADSLWSQALSPPEGAAECNGSRLAVAHVLLRSLPRRVRRRVRRRRDARPVGHHPVSARRQARRAGVRPHDLRGQDAVNEIYAHFGKAIAAYERRLVSSAFEPSPFDGFMAGDDPGDVAGGDPRRRLFVGRAGCNECHRGAMFTDFAFHNVGAPQTGKYVPGSRRSAATPASTC